jgi:hypothetical protein
MSSRFLFSSFAVAASLSLSFVAAGCGSHEQEAAETDSSELRALTPAEIVGTIAPGTTSAPIHYQAPPQYRALSFTGKEGDVVDAWVRSTDGDAIAFLAMASKLKTIADNDDASDSTTDSHLTATLPADGTYYIVFRERDSEPATFTVSLAITPAVTPPIGGVVTTPNAAGKTTLSGTVYDPASKNPLFGVIVYVPTAALAAFTDGPTTDLCSTARSGAPITTAVTGADGRFVLENVPAGVDVPLVMQTGKWRRKVAIPTITAGNDHLVVDKNLTRLPKNRAEGDIPRIAIATGGCDVLECLLRDIGVDDAEFSDGGGAGRIQLYQGNGGSSVAAGAPTSAALWADASKLAGYDMMINACQCAEYPETKPAAALANIVDYANAGGRIFASHYESYAIDPTHITPAAAAPWKVTATFNANGAGNSSASTSIDTSFPKGSSFADWLVNVGASTTKGTVLADDLRYDVTAVAAPATRWAFDAAGDVFLYSFHAPVGEADVTKQKGKVVFSDEHSGSFSSGGAAFPAECTIAGLGPAGDAQRKAFEFTLFELGSCIQDDGAALVVPPNAP